MKCAEQVRNIYVRVQMWKAVNCYIISTIIGGRTRKTPFKLRNGERWSLRRNRHKLGEFAGLSREAPSHHSARRPRRHPLTSFDEPTSRAEMRGKGARGNLPCEIENWRAQLQLRATCKALSRAWNAWPYSTCGCDSPRMIEYDSPCITPLVKSLSARKLRAKAFSHFSARSSTRTTRICVRGGAVPFLSLSLSPSSILLYSVLKAKKERGA